MQAASVTILIEKAKLQPDTAVAIAEAIDMAITAADLVTVPILDARLDALRNELRADMSELRAEMHGIKSELVRWVFVVMLGNVALGAGATALVNALQHAH